MNEANQVSPEVASHAANAQLQYRWRYDVSYFEIMIERYYRQLPVVLHLPIQYLIFWLIAVLVLGVALKIDLIHFAGWALLGGALGIPAAVAITKRGILLKYRFRRSFDTEAVFSVAESGVSYQGISLTGVFPWISYRRSVRFADGILLLRDGAIRWLPDNALVKGSPDEATQIVRSHTEFRLIE